MGFEPMNAAVKGQCVNQFHQLANFSSFSWVYTELSSTTNSFRLGHITPVTVLSLLYIIDASLAVCFQVGICQYTNLLGRRSSNNKSPL